MTAAELAAYIGAAAWAPQLVSWFYRWRTRPVLRLSSAPTVEIGSSVNGPIVNLTAGISVERRDALVEKMTLRAFHQDGDARTLNWTSLGEVGQHFTSIKSGGAEATAELIKNQPAIALRISTLSLEERKVGFQDLEFQRRYKALEAALHEHFTSVRQQTDAEDQTLQSHAFAELQRFFSDNLYWREGEYTFEISLTEPRLAKPHIEAFKVKLTRAHVDSLRANLGLLDPYYRASFAAQLGRPAQLVYFNWAYPEISRL